MPHKYENVTRALAILATEAVDAGIGFQHNSVFVAGQSLDLDDPDDVEVASILMANREFGFAVTWVEQTAQALRALQKVWKDAGDKLESEVAA